MATKQEKQTIIEPTSKPGRKKKIIIIILIFFLLVITSIISLLVLTKPKNDTEEIIEEHTPIYKPLGAFTTNLNDMESYISLKITLKVENEEISTKIEQHLPEVKDIILKELSNSEKEELLTSQGKDGLNTRIITKLTKILEKNPEKPIIQKMLIEEFILQ